MRLRDAGIRFCELGNQAVHHGFVGLRGERLIQLHECVGERLAVRARLGQHAFELRLDVTAGARLR